MNFNSNTNTNKQVLFGKGDKSNNKEKSGQNIINTEIKKEQENNIITNEQKKENLINTTNLLNSEKKNEEKKNNIISQQNKENKIVLNQNDNNNINNINNISNNQNIIKNNIIIKNENEGNKIMNLIPEMPFQFSDCKELENFEKNQLLQKTNNEIIEDFKN